jgi:hypothetical protein
MMPLPNKNPKVRFLENRTFMLCFVYQSEPVENKILNLFLPGESPDEINHIDGITKKFLY